MKIRVAVLDHDTEFMNRLAKAFQHRYEDRLNLSMFSDEGVMYESMRNIRSDIVLTDRKIEMSGVWIPEQTVVIRLCETPDIDEIDGTPAICKYQSVENIYKSILGIYAERSENISLRKSASDAKTILFTSVQGGAGTSSAAAAYALRCAREGRKVFYLDLEKFGDADMYFSCDGTQSFSDVIYALKSRNGNLALRLESIIGMDPAGVDFLHTCKNAYDMFELQDDEIENLLSAISHVKDYEEIIIDLTGDLSERMTKLMEKCVDKIIYISDGSATGNRKFEKFCEAVRVMEQRNDWNILGKTVLLYNRYSSKTGKQLEKAAVPVIGGIHRFEGITEKELIREISRTDGIGLV